MPWPRRMRYGGRPGRERASSQRARSSPEAVRPDRGRTDAGQELVALRLEGESERGRPAAAAKIWAWSRMATTAEHRPMIPRITIGWRPGATIRTRSPWVILSPASTQVVVGEVGPELVVALVGEGEEHDGPLVPVGPPVETGRHGAHAPPRAASPAPGLRETAIRGRDLDAGGRERRPHLVGIAVGQLPRRIADLDDAVGPAEHHHRRRVTGRDVAGAAGHPPEGPPTGAGMSG